MGTVVPRGKVFRAVVRLGGMKPATKTFPTEKEANVWITQTEAAIAGAPRINRGTSLGWVFEKARLAELAKPYKSRSAPQLFARLAREIGDVDLKDLTTEWWIKTVRSWTKLKPWSRLNNLGRIRAALASAETLYEKKVDWAALELATKKMLHKDMRILAVGRPRKRRVTDEEMGQIAAEAALRRCKFPHVDIMEFAVLTCLRREEIFTLKWEELNKVKAAPMLWVRDRKHPTEKIGNDQNIPLLGNAMAIIKRQPRVMLENGELDPRIFPFDDVSYGNSFRMLRDAVGLKNLHFHDLRHEGISRLFEAGYSIPEVCDVSGHKTWECLRIYTQLNPADMHKGPASRRAVAA